MMAGNSTAKTNKALVLRRTVTPERTRLYPLFWPKTFGGMADYIEGVLRFSSLSFPG